MGMLDFLFSEAVMVKIGAAVPEVTGACCKSDITPLGFRWCCNASCNCGGDHEHYLDGLVSWEGYTTWLGSWVYCACVEDDSSEEESEPPVSLSLSIPRVIFTNNDGTAEKSDLAQLSVSFSSLQPTNGYLYITCNRLPDGAEAWIDENKSQRAGFPTSIEIKGRTCFTTNFYIEGTASCTQKNEMESYVEWWNEDAKTLGMKVVRHSTVYYPVANVINDITQSKLIKRLIMCGHGYRERGDLSSGSVFGYTKYDEEGLVDIGFFRGSSRRSPIYHR